MKMKFLLPVLAAVLMTACSNDPKSKAKKSIEAYLQTKLNDAKSYEFVDMDTLTTVTVYDSLKKSYDFDLEQITGMDKKALEYDVLVNLDSVFKLQKKMTDSVNSGYKKAMTEDTKKQIAEYNTLFKFRSKNALGIPMLGTYKFYLDRNFNVVEAVAKN